jgi:hypothetical protein
VLGERKQPLELVCRHRRQLVGREQDHAAAAGIGGLDDDRRQVRTGVEYGGLAC